MTPLAGVGAEAHGAAYVDAQQLGDALPRPPIGPKLVNGGVSPTGACEHAGAGGGSGDVVRSSQVG
ncbi:MAG: hypothetical protein LC750_07540 [Actinobacteria bacterium]|nr:hypothetical protein [Actinomycetota bacterium]